MKKLEVILSPKTKHRFEDKHFNITVYRHCLDSNALYKVTIEKL